MNNDISNTKFKFIPNVNKQLSNDNCDLGVINYFQIASFANPNSNKYHLKRFVINGNNDQMQYVIIFWSELYHACFVIARTRN